MALFVGFILVTLFAGIPLGAGVGGLYLTYAVGLLAFFGLSWMYGTFMEAHFNGRTFGKMMFNLRTISADGRPINASQAALRNLLRLCDFMPPLSLTLLSPDAPPLNLIPTCFLGLLCMTLTMRMQRVGDLAAGTMVVWEGRKGYNTNLKPEDARAYSLAELIPPTFQVSRSMARVVALYMERRAYLSIGRREEVAANLAQPLLRMFDMRADTSADLLLCAIYVRIYHSEEERLQRIAEAKQNRKADQHSPPGKRSIPTARWVPAQKIEPGVATQSAQPTTTASNVTGTSNAPSWSNEPIDVDADVLPAEVLEEVPDALRSTADQADGKLSSGPTHATGNQSATNPKGDHIAQPGNPSSTQSSTQSSGDAS